MKKAANRPLAHMFTALSAIKKIITLIYLKI